MTNEIAMHIVIVLYLLMSGILLYFIYKGNLFNWELERPIVDAPDNTVIRASQELSLAIYECRMEVRKLFGRIILFVIAKLIIDNEKEED